jgi:hypothetical protein
LKGVAEAISPSSELLQGRHQVPTVTVCYIVPKSWAFCGTSALGRRERKKLFERRMKSFQFAKSSDEKLTNLAGRY